ncbi:uncharacterized protein LOC107367796 [Tetranychus urticae]|uniref:Uncharacterized protein n=1 Tax=Tetranychus urticae TaxID=32264 RepID=T1KVF2_TETUR|nr:uncharacterized protein LOC107367796 [Tetranychus urticae]XP_025017757.1 uncharacterized protein LOC107367796 [Tetranychus urticae]XP_025017758.1 uncharacterized protein LOC107367796 [Tetranychus urticae]XP_025017759.1 uncharacterized protein LOC107367796 [Tetranychus urticae]
MRISVILCPILLIICVHLNGATLFSLLGKKNYILAKPRIIIKPKIYIGTSPLLGKKKALAAKAVAGLGVVGILKKLTPKISLPKIELPRLGLPKIPLSFSVSLDKPESSQNEDEVEEAAEAAADAVRNAAAEDPDDLGHSLHTSKKSLSSSRFTDLAWLSDPPPGFSPYGDEFSVEESKSHRSDRLQKGKQQSSPSSSSTSQLRGTNYQSRDKYSKSSGHSLKTSLTNNNKNHNINDDHDEFKKFDSKEIRATTKLPIRRRRRPTKVDNYDEDEDDDER